MILCDRYGKLEASLFLFISDFFKTHSDLPVLSASPIRRSVVTVAREGMDEKLAPFCFFLHHRDNKKHP